MGGSAGRAEDGVPRVTQTGAGDLGSRIPVSLGTCRDGASFINPFFGLRPDVCKSKGLIILELGIPYGPGWFLSIYSSSFITISLKQAKIMKG